MNFEYILALVVLCLLYAACIFFMKRMHNTKLFNLIFIAFIYITYVCSCVYIYKTDTDPTRWNFLNTLPVANVSPFMFSIMPILLILPKKVKEHVYLLISMLAGGMFFSTVFNCVGNAIRCYKFHFHFMLDYLSHFALSAFGIYLVRTKQVKVTSKNGIISGSIILGVATVMLVLNIFFDTAFFGLSLNGKHNIYNMVLVNNSYLSALIYFSGLILVLYLGFVLCNMINKDRFRIKT